MTRAPTSKRGRRQHRGVVPAPGYSVRPGLYTFNNGWSWHSTDELEVGWGPGSAMDAWTEANAKADPEGQPKIVMKSGVRFAVGEWGQP